MIAKPDAGVTHAKTAERSAYQLRNDYAEVPMDEGLAEIDAAVALLRQCDGYGNKRAANPCPDNSLTALRSNDTKVALANARPSYAMMPSAKSPPAS